MEMIHWSMALYISEWVIRIVMLFVVPRRRKPASAMAWLLVIFFLPPVGLVLYLLIGRNRLPKRRIKQHARLLEEMRAVNSRFRDRARITKPSLGPTAAATEALAERLGDMPIIGGNSVEITAGNEAAINSLIADIDQAERHVHMLFYIYSDDAVGFRVCDALERAVKRGVKCRALVDAVGSKHFIKKLSRRMKEAGVEMRLALPVGLLRSWVARLDLRNHRKILVVDGRIAYTGSQNIVDASYGHKDLVWRDMMLRLTGPIVLELQAVFVGDWFFETDEILDDDYIFPEIDEAGTVAVQALPSGPNYPTENYQRMVVAALHSATERVTITTPYFVPDDAFMQAMQTAVLRGVEVDLVVPARCDQIMVAAASRAYYEYVLEAGVKLHLYNNGLLHAKTMSVDTGIAFIGSSNFDIRSFALNFEINMLFYDRGVADSLREKQRQYIADSTLVSLDQWRKRSSVKRTFDNMAKLLSPLL